MYACVCLSGHACVCFTPKIFRHDSISGPNKRTRVTLPLSDPLPAHPSGNPLNFQLRSRQISASTISSKINDWISTKESSLINVNNVFCLPEVGFLELYTVIRVIRFLNGWWISMWHEIKIQGNGRGMQLSTWDAKCSHSFEKPLELCGFFTLNVFLCRIWIHSK